jgi:cation diffusion facilitator family transporter
MPQQPLRWLLILSILTAVFTIGLKTTAYALTGSVGLLSDAVESGVNLIAAITALLSLYYAMRPVDSSHTYGHEKIEFFSSGLEGMLILVAAASIGWYAIGRLFSPPELETLGLGLAISVGAAVVNGVVGFLLVYYGRKNRSLIVEADGKHLLTDVWTSGGVLIALCLVAWTGWVILDPLIALVVAGNILWTAWGLLRRSFDGLMDHALPKEEQETVRAAIAANLAPNMDFHALRTREAGSRRFVDFHLLVPGEMTVKEAHALTDRVEKAIEATLEDVEVTVHIEPIEDRQAYEDSALVPIEEAERAKRQGERNGGDQSVTR